MRICYLAPASNYHTEKWSKYFACRDNDVHVISFTPGEIEGVTVHHINVGVDTQGGDVQKLRYLASVHQVRKTISEIHPDILHAHYATSYGIVCAKAAQQDYFLSVWGSDVYEFPQSGPLHRALVKHSLAKATWLMSTSQAMANEAAKYTDKEFLITPFGVDMDLFTPEKRTRPDNDGRFVIGTVKGLEQKYGIHHLLRAAAIVVKERPDIPLEVRIAGKGTQENALRALADELGLHDRVTWLGFIPQEQAAREWANLDIAIIASESESESFGVSAVEAQASGVPVIISDIPGLMEACDDGSSAVVVPRRDAGAVAKSIEALYDNQSIRKRMADMAVKFVRDTYDLEGCFHRVEEAYEQAVGAVG